MTSDFLSLSGTALTPGELKRRVAAEFGFRVADLEGPGRNHDLVIARHEAVARMHEAFPAMSLPALARQFGGRDHTSILFILRKKRSGRYSQGSSREVHMVSKPFDRDEARRLYLVEMMSIKAIAAYIGARKERVRLCFSEKEIRKAGLMCRRKPRPIQMPKRASIPQPREGKMLPEEASVWHLIDLKRAGHSTAEYRENCEISPFEDARERRALGRQPRVIPARGQEGSWMGSPAALCAV